jgi:cellulose synthase/poly-beta-1,6-N-acetylglucosamine synthase-like glycosyltransferase
LDVTIAVGTYGSDDWHDLAKERAIPSAEAQGVPVVHVHGGTLAEARNAALEQVETEFVIHLDADDELTPGYIDAMSTGTADLRAPAIRQVRAGRVGRPFMPQVWKHKHACSAECLRAGNWIVIGACVRTELVRDVGGWEEWGWSEDWALWARCWKAGATIEAIPGAVYRAHVRPASRNHCLSNGETVEWHRRIERAVWPEEFASVA